MLLEAIAYYRSVRGEAAENTEKREIADRRTYGHMCQSAHEW